LEHPFDGTFTTNGYAQAASGPLRTRSPAFPSSTNQKAFPKFPRGRSNHDSQIAPPCTRGSFGSGHNWLLKLRRRNHWHNASPDCYAWPDCLGARQSENSNPASGCDLRRKHLL
jgi:hypothetical protein